MVVTGGRAIFPEIAERPRMNRILLAALRACWHNAGRVPNKLDSTGSPQARERTQRELAAEDDPHPGPRRHGGSATQRERGALCKKNRPAWWPGGFVCEPVL